VYEEKKSILRSGPRSSSPLQLQKTLSKTLEEHVAELSSLQHLHYASGRYALLLIFQALDAAGKDGSIRHVMSGVNPEGCEVFSFKQPSADELQHDFSVAHDVPSSRTRAHRHLQSFLLRGSVVVRVHPEILRNQGLPKNCSEEKDMEGALPLIVDLEEHLFRNGTRIVKIFLHLSKNVQRKASSNVLTSRRRIGNSVFRTFTRGNTGKIIRRLTRSAARHEHPPRALVRCSRR